MMEEEIELVVSPLSQIIKNGNQDFNVEIYGNGQGAWILEVVHEDGSSTVWDSTFATDTEALTEAKKFVLESASSDVKH